MLGRAPAASLEPDSISRASIDPSVRSSVPAIGSVASLLSAETLLRRSWPAAIGMADSARLRDNWPLQGLAHQVGNTAGFDRQPLIDRARNSVEGARIKAGDLAIGQHYISGALQRANESDRTQAGTFQFRR